MECVFFSIVCFSLLFEIFCLFILVYLTLFGMVHVCSLLFIFHIGFSSVHVSVCLPIFQNKHVFVSVIENFQTGLCNVSTWNVWSDNYPVWCFTCPVQSIYCSVWLVYCPLQFIVQCCQFISRMTCLLSCAVYLLSSIVCSLVSVVCLLSCNISVFFNSMVHLFSLWYVYLQCSLYIIQNGVFIAQYSVYLLFISQSTCSGLLFIFSIEFIIMCQNLCLLNDNVLTIINVGLYFRVLCSVMTKLANLYALFLYVYNLQSFVQQTRLGQYCVFSPCSLKLCTRFIQQLCCSLIYNVLCRVLMLQN